MKKHILPLIFLTSPFLWVPGQVMAIECQANGSGNWTSSGTWNCGTTPGAGVQVVIDENAVVTVNSNLSYAGSPMHVKVKGTWNFQGGGAKITLPAGSSVELIDGGKVTGNGNGNSQTIKIGGTTYWSASQGTVNGPWIWPETLLAVDLISFQVTNEDHIVSVDWTTTGGENTAYFEVMRAGSTTDWTKIATVPAGGGSGTLEYSIRDKVHPGIWYYRLFEVEESGQRIELGTASVHVEEPEQFTCGPVLLNEGVVMANWPGHELLAVELIDMHGKAGRAELLDRSAATMQIDLSHVPPGIHMLRVTDDRGEQRTCKVLRP